MNNCATILQTTTGSTRVLHRLRHSHVSSKVGTSRALHHLTISLASHLSLCLVLSSGVSLWFSSLALSTPIECEPRLRNEQRECVRKIPQAELYKKKPRLPLLLNTTLTLFECSCHEDAFLVRRRSNQRIRLCSYHRPFDRSSQSLMLCNCVQLTLLCFRQVRHEVLRNSRVCVPPIHSSLA